MHGRSGGRPRIHRGGIGLGEAAGRGALAGLAGGAALIGMNELATRGLLAADGAAGKGRSRQGPAIRRGARRTVKAAGRKVGLHLSRDQGDVAAIGLELVAAAGIGAAFGMIVSRVQLPASATGPLLGGLVYAATLAGVLPAGGALASPGGSSWRDAIRPAGPQAMFGLVTARTFELLLGR